MGDTTVILSVTIHDWKSSGYSNIISERKSSRLFALSHCKRFPVVVTVSTSLLPLCRLTSTVDILWKGIPWNRIGSLLNRHLKFSWHILEKG